MSSVEEVAGAASLARPDRATCRALAGESRQALLAVVGGVHLGMLKATVERLGSPLDVAGLEPFVRDDPTECIVKLAARS
jgi:hypothetical protein